MASNGAVAALMRLSRHVSIRTGNTIFRPSRRVRRKHRASVVPGINDVACSRVILRTGACAMSQSMLDTILSHRFLLLSIVPVVVVFILLVAANLIREKPLGLRTFMVGA